jgi:hypothetical protein
MLMLMVVQIIEGLFFGAGACVWYLSFENVFEKN